MLLGKTGMLCLHNQACLLLIKCIKLLKDFNLILLCNLAKLSSSTCLNCPCLYFNTTPATECIVSGVIYCMYICV